MAAVHLSPAAAKDEDEIVGYLLDKAGFDVAARYVADFRSLRRNLAQFPESGAPRPRLGRGTRLRIVAPYNVFYEYDAERDTVTILRVMHGARRQRQKDIRP